MAIVDAVLLELAISNLNCRALIFTLWATVILLLGACGSGPAEQAQVVSDTPTSVPTTVPLAVPTSTPVPAPTPTPAAPSEVTSTPLPTPTILPTLTVDPAPSPTTTSDAAQASTAAVTATATAEVIETPTSVPTPTAAEPETDAGVADSDSDSDSDPSSTSTPVAETPTAVVAASGEPPLECYDADVQVYRAYVDGVDELSFEGGRVYCAGAGTNAVSAARSYRHSSGLIVNRNADYMFNDGGTAYIPYSGSLHFCVNGQPASAPFRAETVPALLVVIDNEAQRQIAQGATGPAAFSGSTSQC